MRRSDAMSTDYRVEMQQENIIDQQARELTKTGMSLDDAYEMVEDWHSRNDYGSGKSYRIPSQPSAATDKRDLKVYDIVKLYEEQTGRNIPTDIVDAMKFLQWQGRNGDTRKFKDRSIIQVLRYFIKYYEEK
jgi:hypothetical protein